MKARVSNIVKTTILSDISAARAKAQAASENGGDYTARLQAVTDVVILSALQFVIDNHDNCPALIWYMAVIDKFRTIFTTILVIAAIALLAYAGANNIGIP